MTPARLPVAQIAPLLRSLPDMLQIELDALPPGVAGWHPGPDEWCAKDVIGHLIEAERRGFAGRIQQILGHAEPALEEWDPVQLARERRDCERDAVDLLHELKGLRRESVGLVARLSAADLDRAGIHSRVGRLRIGDLLHEWVHHDRNHLRQILANLQAFAWPHMGNAQRFSET
jgi:hypothetical protein